MAKLSVYVPDDLLAAAKAADADMSLSSVLQDCLRSRLVDRQARPYARVSDELERERAEAQRVVVARVTEAYETGYRVGVGFAKLLPWEAFEALARVGWKLSTWVEEFDAEDFEDPNPRPEQIAAERTNLSSWTDLLAEATATVGWFPVDDAHVPSGVTGEGFADALRDVWEGARDNDNLPSALTDDRAPREASAGSDQ